MPGVRHEFDIAISYAGEDRPYAEALAVLLQERGVKVFFDVYEQSTLWGKNLYTYLTELYQKRARYCVMFLSQHYAQKLWTNLEREAAQARAFMEHEEYILPVRLDDTDIPGVLPTIDYLDWFVEGSERIADLVMEKLNKEPHVSSSPIHKRSPEQIFTGTSTIKVLIVFANPHDASSLRLGAEDRAIHEAIKLSNYRDRIILTILHAATVHDLRRALLEDDFQIVHLSGHGSDEGLILEDTQGRGYIVPQEALAELFGAYSPPLQCIILNACYSISQGHLVSLGIPFTIAMEGPISDEAAIEFVRGFYDAIGAGRSIDFAYQEGCRTVKLAAPNTQFVSTILKRDNT